MPPAFEPTDDQRRTVEKLSGLGLPQGDIAQVVGVDEKTLRKHLRAELDSGTAKANSQVAEFLFDAATGKRGEGSAAITAAIFWAKTRMRWKEVSVTEVTGAGGGPIETRHLSPEERAAQALALIDATFGLVSHGGADADR
jgi:hypothetical protein